MTKKILSGVLAAVSALTMSASAFASSNEKQVKAAGELEYEVNAVAPKVVLDLVMPAKLEAALNPYGAEIKLDADGTNTTDTLIASTAYKITNKSQDYGVYIDATAITTVETADKTKWKVTAEKVVNGTKGATLALIGADAVDAFATAAEGVKGQKITSAAATESTQGILAMDSSVEANKETGVVAGQTSMKKLFFVKADADGSTPGEIYIGFAGDLAASDKAKGEVEWTEDDAINVNLVLKVTAGPKTFPTP